MPDPPEQVRPPAIVAPRRPDDFEASYTGAPPWDIGRPQPEFLRLAESGILRGPVLDVGCGTGEHALMAALLGLEATGVDIAPTAIKLAQQKAQERGLRVRFAVWDALDLSGLGEKYATVFDAGVFHVFEDDERRRYVDSLRAVMLEGGSYHMLSFSDRQPGDWGPRRIAEADIRTSFAEGWRIEILERVVFDLTLRPDGAQAWLFSATRI